MRTKKIFLYIIIENIMKCMFLSLYKILLPLIKFLLLSTSLPAEESPACGLYGTVPDKEKNTKLISWKW